MVGVLGGLVVWRGAAVVCCRVPRRLCTFDVVLVLSQPISTI